MRTPSQALLYVGVALVALGFTVISMAWGKVAGLDSVSLQVPYLVSGGLSGLGLIIVGSTAVNIHAKRREGAERELAMQQLTELLRRLLVAAGQEQDVDQADSPSETPLADSNSHDQHNPADTREFAWGG